MQAINAIRGMNDLLPADTPLWRRVEGTARAVLDSYGYAEIRTPLLERTELFRRSIGEVTDIVEKEMYTFTDRNGESLTLRPECTASCVRALIEHGMLRQPGQRLWYLGPMFRHERPQRGRFRQFFQIGAEAFGYANPEIDAELILLAARLWRALGLDGMRLELNSLGTREEQAAYRERLVAYLRAHRESLDEDCERRLETNPLRVLDSKNPEMRELLDAAPALGECLGAESRAHLATLVSILADAGVEATLNPRLVRGLDYYTRTVFEWVGSGLGAQNAACGGGRYDTLVAEIGGPATPAIGFSIGVERIIELLRGQGLEPPGNAPHAYLAAVGEHARQAAPGIAERLRDRATGLRMLVDAGEGSLKAKLRRAHRSGAGYAVLIGDDELAAEIVTLKPLLRDQPQRTVDLSSAAEALAAVVTGA